MSKLIPMPCRVVVEPLATEKCKNNLKSTSIFIPQEIQSKYADQTQVGTVKAIGPGCFEGLGEDFCTVGTKVAFIKYAGTVDPTGLTDYRIIKDNDIIFKIEED